MVIMSRKSDQVKELRQQVLARQRAASKKISRHKSKGVNLEGTRYDPRKPPETINRLNTRQLQSHLAKVENFMSRKTQFVADATGKILSPGQWERYQKAQREVNRTKQKAFNAIKDILIPGGRVTIGDRQKIVTPDRPTAGNPAANPFVLVNRRPNAFTSEKALKKLTRDLEKKLKSDFLAKDLATDRRVARDMTKQMNRPDIQAKLDDLSDFHFNILWNFTKFATDLSRPYWLAKEKVDGSTRKKGWHERIIEDNLSSAVEQIDAIKTIKLRS